MASKPDVWMPLYFGDYLSDTMHLNTEQHGAYLLLLMACWKRGGRLPNDDEQLATITRLPIERWRRMRPVIKRFWSVTQDGWTQGRLSLELAAANHRHQTATRNGTKGGRPRKPNDNLTLNLDDTGTQPEANRNESSSPSPSPSPLSSPSTSPSTSPRKGNGVHAADAAMVWTEYSAAYQKRYGVEPTRNASVNAKLAQFMKRVPADDAPSIAEFFVRSNEPFYVRSRHPVGLLLKDAEKLRTEWLTGATTPVGRQATLEARNREAAERWRPT